ncbi:MAG: hypothetical protein GC200_10230 [Tepidisphaera sp.]|nr:hypothetical protein [Tepidisphaera sp.]
MNRVSMLAACACGCLGGAAFAQPTQFNDLGPHLAPENFRVPVQLQSGDDIQWFRIELPEASADAGFVDIWSDPPEYSGCPEHQNLGEIQLIQYSSAGEGLTQSFMPQGLETIVRLSFGLATDIRSPVCLQNLAYPQVEPAYFCTETFAGQDGPLAADVYWFAVGHRLYPHLHNWEVPTDADPAAIDRCAVLNFHIQPAGVPYCNGDYNWDGVADQGDIDYLINIAAGGENPTGRDADFNRDGVVDQGDVDALINVVAGGECP